MRLFVATTAAAVVALGLGLLAGRASAPRNSYDYGLTGNDWWQAQQHATAQALDRGAPGAR